MSIKRMTAGFTLIEMIIAIVIISVGVVGVLVAFSTSVRGSADALVGKQLVAIAEEIMEEVLLKPYSAIVANKAATVCGTAAANRSAFADTMAYNGYQTTGICDIDGQPVAGLEGYNVAVAVAASPLGGINDALRVTVTATRGGQSMVLDGFRVAPVPVPVPWP